MQAVAWVRAAAGETRLEPPQRLEGSQVVGARDGPCDEPVPAQSIYQHALVACELHVGEEPRLRTMLGDQRERLVDTRGFRDNLAVRVGKYELSVQEREHVELDQVNVLGEGGFDRCQ